MKIENVSRVANRVCLKTNGNKSKIMRVKSRNQGHINIDKVYTEKVGECKYLGIYVSKDGNI